MHDSVVLQLSFRFKLTIMVDFRFTCQFGKKYFPHIDKIRFYKVTLDLIMVNSNLGLFKSFKTSNLRIF